MNDRTLFLWAKQQLDGATPPELDDLINRVRSLPNLSIWAPRHDGINILDVLSLGVVLGRVDHESFQPLLTKVADAIKIAGRPNTDDMAELHAAALLQGWVDELKHIHRTNTERTPDLIARIGEDHIDIEVTKAAQKEEQRVRQEAGHRLQEKLSALASPCHLTVYFLDMLTDDEVDAVVEAASKLSSGNIVEVPERWYIYAGPQIVGDKTIELSSIEPSWWPKQYATPACFGGTFMSGVEEGARSSVQIQWGLSDKAYRNPIERKASRSQHSGKYPFVIALDATQMPGALGWYGHNLAEDLPLWDHVSGVLVFQSEVRIMDSLGWRYRLFPNPGSTYLLPSSFLHQAESGNLTVPFFSG